MTFIYFRWTSSLIYTWHPCSPLPCQKPHQLELLFSQVKATDFVPLFNHPPSSSPLDQLASQLRFSTTSQSCAACSLPHSSLDIFKKLGSLPLLCIQATSCPPIYTDTPGSTGQLQASWGPGQSLWHRPLPVWWWHFSGRSFPRAPSTSTTASPLNQRRLSVIANCKTASGTRHWSAWSRKWARAAALDTEGRMAFSRNPGDRNPKILIRGIHKLDHCIRAELRQRGHLILS